MYGLVYIGHWLNKGGLLYQYQFLDKSIKSCIITSLYVFHNWQIKWTEKRAPVAQVVVHPTSKQEVLRFDPWAGTNGNFLSTSTEASGGSESTLNCRSHHKEVSDLQGRGPMSRGKLFGGFSVILRDLLFLLILEDSQTP